MRVFRLLFASVVTSAVLASAGCKPAAAPGGGDAPPSPAAPGEPVKPTQQDLEKVRKAVEPFEAGASLPSADHDLNAVVVFLGMRPLKDADVPEVARRLEETGVPVGLRLAGAEKLTVESHRRLFRMPNLVEITAVGGNARRALDEHPRSERVESLQVSEPTPELLRKFPNLRGLSTGFDAVPGPGAALGELTELRSLALGGTALADADLAVLAKLTKLNKLWLGGTKLTSAGLVHVAGLTELRSLGFEPATSSPDAELTDATLAHLARLSKLEGLSLRGKPVTDAGMAHLKGLTALRNLTVRGVSKVGADGLKVVAGLPELESLSFMDARPPAAAFAGLAGAPKLKTLRLSNASPAEVQDLVDHLAAVPKLEQVQVLAPTIVIPPPPVGWDQVGAQLAAKTGGRVKLIAR